MTKRLARILCVALLGLVIADGFADAACPDSGPDCAVVCHSCACGPRIASNRPSTVAAAPAVAPYPACEPALYALLLPESLFQPPRLLA